MNERVRRPILHLKLGAAPAASPAETDAAAPAASRIAAPRLAAPGPAATPPAPSLVWKCRPCGSSFEPPRAGPDDEVVRCPSCNARLGKAGDFRLDPLPLERLRARAAKAPPPPPPPTPRPTRGQRTAPVVTVKVLKKVR
jgi:hypothetical protein